MIYKKILRPVLFRFDAEAIHEWTIKMLSVELFDNLIKPFFHYENKALEVKAGKLTFKNPIGLAAGMDKNATALNSWEAMGFGFAEVGTVTPLPQDGNPKPRIFRLPKYGAIINRLGFNNCGADEFLINLKKLKDELPNEFKVGVNIGKNARTPLEEAYQDYKFSFEKCFEYADYFTINVSSPNTEGLRSLQQKKFLDEILMTLQKQNKELDELYACDTKDIYLKIAPDLETSEIDDIIEVSIDNGITGLIITNTTVSRKHLPENQEYEKGGLSGYPLKETANNILKYVKKNAGDKLVLIGCGGIFNADDVKEKLDLGASLVQIYTGMIFEGPFVVKKIKKKMLLERNTKV